VGGGGGGEEGKFSCCTLPKLHVLNQIFLKTSKFPNKKATFDVNLVFTATLACTKRALFNTKKGTFGPPPVLTPLTIATVISINSDAA
jgi:hypothetical protein